jgi:NADH:ubiquinone oxidoreductase subunit 6 (subunit J)
MKEILPYFVIAAAIGVVIVLLLGLVNMVRASHSPRTSNRLMQWRVGLQLGAVILLLLLLLLSRS